MHRRSNAARVSPRAVKVKNRNINWKQKPVPVLTIQWLNSDTKRLAEAMNRAAGYIA